MSGYLEILGGAGVDRAGYQGGMSEPHTVKLPSGGAAVVDILTADPPEAPKLRLRWVGAGGGVVGFGYDVSGVSVLAAIYSDGCGGWVGDAWRPTRGTWQEAARDAEAAALDGARLRLRAAREVVRALGGGS